MRLWNGALHPTASECVLPHRADCASLLKAQMVWAPWLVTCGFRRALRRECGVCALMAGATDAGALGCPAADALAIALYASHDTHMNLWGALLGATAGARGASVLNPARFWPWYVANYAFELWTEDEKEKERERHPHHHHDARAWVRVLFNDAPVTLRVRGEEREWVTLDEWEGVVRDYLLEPDSRAAWCASA